MTRWAGKPESFQRSADFRHDTIDALANHGIQLRLGDARRVYCRFIAMLIRAGVSSCRELLESVPQPSPDDALLDVVDGDDIETGG